MKTVKMLYREPKEAEFKDLKVYDNLDEYLRNEYDGDFVRTGFEHWTYVEIDNQRYYCFSNDWRCEIDYGQAFITENVYKEILKYCKKTYSIHASDLFRGNSCRFTGDLSSIEDVIDYMKDDKRSWLPDVCKEIDKEITTINREIEDLKNKILQLEADKVKLYDEDYLKSKIKMEYTFDSQFYKSLKNEVSHE